MKPKPGYEVVYLCGGVDNAPDRGVGWRMDWTDKLTKLGHTVIDPTFQADRESAKRLGWVQFDKKRWDSLPETDWDQWQSESHKIAHNGMNGVVACNIVLVKFDQYIGMGSSGEMTLGHFLNRAVYIWLDGGRTKADLPVWAGGVLTDVFESAEELYRHFKRLQQVY